MSVGQSAVIAAQSALSRHPRDAGVRSAAEQVLAVVGRQEPLGLGRYADCNALSSDTELSGRALFGAACSDWQADLDYSLRALRDALLEVGDGAAAETTESAQDASDNFRRELGGILPDAGDLWDSTPDWVKAIAVVTFVAFIAGGAHGR